jgi:glycosyltransferase involved in cell wall biosynthesis
MAGGPVPAATRTASVVITCYNYGRFVASAIESALRQSQVVEVIVVDDGSTDDSRAVIARYGDRVQAVFKENGGQGSAFNAGCRLAQGDAVFLLDADDELRPDAVETVLAAWRPETVLVQWRPSQMDAEGRDIPGTVPAQWIPLDEGDVCQRMLATGGYSVTVTSGLALRRDALLSVLPMPEGPFRYAADGFLVRAMAFLGPVQVVDRPLTRYRVHGSNEIGGSPARMAATYRKYIAWARQEFEALKSLAHQHRREVAAAVGEQSPDFLRWRIYSLVTDPANHPIPGDTRARLLPRLIAAHWRMPIPLGHRLLTVAVDSAVSLLPRPLGCQLLAWRYAAQARPRWLVRYAAWHRRRSAT